MPWKEPTLLIQRPAHVRHRQCSKERTEERSGAFRWYRHRKQLAPILASHQKRNFFAAIQFKNMNPVVNRGHANPPPRMTTQTLKDQE
jgi:hypothetical protein